MHATADDGTVAAPNWGAAFTPRIGTEVLVDFEHADIDRPIIVGSLHNPADAQPWPAGADSAANHPGTILGVHVPTLDAAGWAQWLRCSSGGTYHVWDEGTKQWVRNKNILCDPATGNIGWDTTKEANSGKTVDELHKRDADEYKKGKKGQSDEHPWRYTGVCYADHLSGE